jgi:hypothetical protein
MVDLKDIVEVYNASITYNIGFGNPFTLSNLNYNFPINDISFQPNFALIKNISVSSPTANNRVYRIVSNISLRPLITFKNASNLVWSPERIIPIRFPINNIQLDLQELTIGANNTLDWSGPTSNPALDPLTTPITLNIEIDFVSISGRKDFAVKVM